MTESKITPREPTPEMLDAAYGADPDDELRRKWIAMHDAAPEAPPAEMPKLPKGDIARRFLDACGVEHWEFSHSDAQLRAYAREYAAAQNALLREALEDALSIFEFGADDKTVVAPKWVARARDALKGTP